MQIPTAAPLYQPPVRSTKPASSSGSANSIAKSRESGQASRATETDAAADDVFTSSAYEPLQQAMNQLPDSRADVVARGKALIADPTYPAVKIISKLADLFVADAQASLAGDN